MASEDPFELACDRLSQTVDATQFERLRWARTEGPMLARLVELAHAAIENRPDFEMTEEGSTSEAKRFALKVHSLRTVAVIIALDGHRANLQIEALDRSRYRVEPGPDVSAEFTEVDEAWMAAALGELFGRIRA